MMAGLIPAKYLPCVLVALNVIVGACLFAMILLTIVIGMPLPLPTVLPVGTVFQDDFASEKATRDNGWVFVDEPKVQVRWTPGSLTQLVKIKNYNYSSFAGKPLRDMAFEVDAEASQDPQMVIGAYGIVFGGDSRTNDSFRFAVTTSGSYSLAKVHDSKMVKPYIIDFTFSPYIELRPAKNRLGVIVEGSKISLYINGSLVDTAVDDSVASGQIGVFTDSLWSDRAEVRYSRVRILSVERAKLEWGTRFAGEPAPPNGIFLKEEFKSEQAATDDGWSFGDGKSGSYNWTPNGYSIRVKEQNSRVSTLLSRTYKDVGIEIEAQPMDDSAWYGLVFRASTEGGFSSDEYRFTVYPTRGEWWYFLVKQVDGKSPQPWPAEPAPARLIKNPGKNRLGVLVEGATISLYINGHRMRTVKDESLSTGEVGVFVHNVNAERAEVVFSKLTIMTVEKAKAEWGVPPDRPGVLFQTDFSSRQLSEEQGWDYEPLEGIELSWSPGKLTMAANGRGHFNGPFYSQFKDFAIEMEAQPDAKEFTSYGIYFREQVTGKVRSCYSFSITPSGRYFLIKVINGQVIKPYPVDIALSPYINKGNSKNRLGVIAEGDRISLYINRNFIKTIVDSTLPYGTVGAILGPSGSDREKIDVTDFTVYSVQEAKKQWGDPSTARMLPAGVLLDDDFSSRKQSMDSGWIFESDDLEQVAWAPNRLTVGLKKSYMSDVIPIWSVFDNFGMQVEAQAEDKPDNTYGISFRIGDSSTGNGRYVFFITTQGMYSLLKRVNGEWAKKDLIPLTASPYIKQGSSKNRLGVLADGPTISLFINGYLVRSIEDSEILRGNVGLAVSNGRGGPSDFIFSRVTIYDVERGKTELGKK